MICLQNPSKPAHTNKPLRFALITTMFVLVILASLTASAQLAPNQTRGFGADELVTFTYTQNFDCVDQPHLDLDFNG